MEQVVITGRGLITPLGNGLEANARSLYDGESGIKPFAQGIEYKLESNVAGQADEDPECPLLDKKVKRFATANSMMAVAAAYEALNEAGLTVGDLRGRRVAMIIGCAGSTHKEVFDCSSAFIDSGNRVRKVSPFVVPRVMASSAVANLALILGITGETYDISSACTSSAHSIMLATRLLRCGEYDMVISGGTEELNWIHALGFDAMKALSRRYNATPAKSSRPFDRDRDGFVIAEGAGIVIMESAAHAKSRGAKPIAAVTGIAANSNGFDMVVPSAESSSEVMAMAIKDAGLKINDIDYINTHGTSTPVGDPIELSGIKRLFGDNASDVAINSTKSMTGHMIGATGACEVIFCTQMMENGFISPSINLENVEPGYEWADLVRETRDGVKLRHCLSNSFGFGGTNAALVISDIASV